VTSVVGKEIRRAPWPSGKKRREKKEGNEKKKQPLKTNGAQQLRGQACVLEITSRTARGAGGQKDSNYFGKRNPHWVLSGGEVPKRHSCRQGRSKGPMRCYNGKIGVERAWWNHGRARKEDNR